MQTSGHGRLLSRRFGLRDTLFDIREAGRARRRECPKAGSLCFFDLQSPPNIVFDLPFETVRSYVPLRALQQFAQEAGGSRHVGAPSSSIAEYATTAVKVPVRRGLAPGRSGAYGKRVRRLPVDPATLKRAQS